MDTSIIEKIDNRTLQTREIKKFPLFSEHTSYGDNRAILTHMCHWSKKFMRTIKVQNLFLLNFVVNFIY